MTLIASSCSGDDASTTELATDTSQVVVAPEPTPLPTTDPILPAPEPTSTPAPTAIPLPEEVPEFGPTGRPSYASEVNVLTAKPSVNRPTVYDEADGEVIPVKYEYLNGTVDETYDWFINPTFFGNPLAVMVIEGEPGDKWAKVQIPTRPTMEGWVSTDEFTWSESDFYVQVDIATNTVKVWDGDEVIVDDVSVVTGDTGRETPIASTYIDEIVPGPSGAYGPWIVSLGVFSEAINTFGSAGGLPKVALHGTNQPGLLGQYASNGCIRLPNDIITMIVEQVPVGTRVDLMSSTEV